MMKKGLGRGLNALLDNREETTTPEATTQGVTMLDIRLLEPNIKQPRQYFDEAALEELAASIKSYGIIQPLLVKESGGYYTIIAGERRYRAARLAHLTEVPVVIKEYTAMDELQVALIENIQRQDLTPIEEAQCYARLMEEFFFSAEDIGQKLGKSKHAIAGALQLLKLSPAAQAFAVTGELTASHAKILLSVEDPGLQASCAEKIVQDGLSVRASEAMISQVLKIAAKQETEEAEGTNAQTRDNLRHSMATAYRSAENELQRILGSNVHIRPGKKSSKIEIEYYSNADLERILDIFKKL